MGLYERGTLHLAIDTSYRFPFSFKCSYKEIDFKYILGEINSSLNTTDSCIAKIIRDEHDDYKKISELISLFSLEFNASFIIRSCCTDKFNGQLSKKEPCIVEPRMLTVNDMGCQSSGIFPYGVYEINNQHQSQLINLYRCAKAIKHIDYVNSFLYYYHILDYQEREDSHKGQAINYIDQTEEILKPDWKTERDYINQNRFFQVDDSQQKSLGQYIHEIRNSVVHIIRDPNRNSQNIDLASLEQHKHFSKIVAFLEKMAIFKLKNQHKFNNHVELETYQI